MWPFKKAAVKPDVVELGSSGLNVRGGRVQEEWHKALRGGTATQRVFLEMETDAVLGAGLSTLRLLMQRAPLRVKPASDDGRALAVATFLEECLDDMRRTWAAWSREADSFLTFGWSLSEVVLKKRDGVGSAYSDGRWGLADLAPRAQETLQTWDVTPQGDVLAFNQASPTTGKTVRIPLERCIHLAYDARKGNPEGRSLLRSAYVDWYHGKRVLQFEGIGVERDLCGVPVMRAPAAVVSGTDAASVAARETYDKMLSNFRQDQQAYLLLPSEDGYEFKLMGSPGAKQYDTDKILRRCDQRKAMALGTEVQLLGMDKVGSYALADSKTSLLGYAVASLLDFKTEELNRQLVPLLMKVNGIDEKDWPWFEHGEVETPEAGPLATACQALASAGMLTPDLATENRLRGFLDLPLLEEKAGG